MNWSYPSWDFQVYLRNGFDLVVQNLHFFMRNLVRFILLCRTIYKLKLFGNLVFAVFGFHFWVFRRYSRLGIIFSGLCTTKMYFGCRFVRSNLFSSPIYNIKKNKRLSTWIVFLDNLLFRRNCSVAVTFHRLFFQHHAGFFVEPAASVTGEQVVAFGWSPTAWFVAR